jgi:hypothetical protein
MKSIILLIVAILVLSTSAFAERVNGYYRKNGTYVQPYQRSTRDNNPYNNYSSKGNINPYTGSRGYTQPTTPYIPSPYKTTNHMGIH